MRAAGLSVADFRNYEKASIRLCDGINIICGKNGQGKTNLLEGLYYGSSLCSFRGARDRELAGRGKDRFNIIIDYNARGRDMEISVSYENGKKEIKLNGIKRRNREIIGGFVAVLFAPEHLDLIKGAPLVRRRFLDLNLCRLSPAYYTALSNYKRALRQKSALLRNMRQTGKKYDATLDVWNGRLVKFGAYIISLRRDYCKDLSVCAKKVHFELSGEKENLSIIYNPTVDIGKDYDSDDIMNEFKNGLLKVQQREIENGICLFGCHRDDIKIKINSKIAKTFASQGQQRSAVFAVKMGECELFREKIGEYPVLLLDDILSELDEERRKYIAENIENMQVVITCCEDIDKLFNKGKIFTVDNGKVF